MKTIDVYLLTEVTWGDVWVARGMTASILEAEEWKNSSPHRDYDEYDLTLPQEIQVQSDY